MGIKMKIAYVGIDLLSKALFELRENGCEIIKIFTCKTDNVTEFNVKIIDFARKNNIPYTLDRITSEDIKGLNEQGCDALICGGYYHLIPTDNDLPMVNIHPTLLPIGRGSWPMPIIIMNKYKKSGVTFHKMSERFDEGDIILQKEFELAVDENHQSYMEKVDKLIPDMISELTKNFIGLYDNARLQTAGEYWELPDKSMYTVNSDMDYEQVELILRAFYGYECYYVNGDKTYELIGAQVVRTKNVDGIYYPVKGGYIKSPIVKEI